MKSQYTLTQLAQQIMDRSNAKNDLIADTRDIAIAADGQHMELSGGKRLAINDHAHGQIAAHANIPAAYYGRMRQEAPHLVGANVRAWFDKYPSRRMVRTLDVNGFEASGVARAFLSDKYSRMDDDAFAEVVLPAISDVPGAEVVSCGMTDTRTTIKMKSARIAREVKVGDEVQFGLSFSNSEVGSGRLVGSLFCYRLACLNGMVIEDEQFAATHVQGKRQGGRDLGEIFQLDTINMDSKATILKLRDFAREALTDRFIDAQVQKMRGLTEVAVNDPVKAIEQLAKRHTFTEAQSKSVLSHLIQGGDLSMWGLANAVTRTAEDQADYDDATRFETLGGRMLNLPKADYKELLAA